MQLERLLAGKEQQLAEMGLTEEAWLTDAKQLRQAVAHTLAVLGEALNSGSAYWDVLHPCLRSQRPSMAGHGGSALRVMQHPNRQNVARVAALRKPCNACCQSCTQNRTQSVHGDVLEAMPMLTGTQTVLGCACDKLYPFTRRCRA